MINVEDCSGDQCKGKAIIELFNKKNEEEPVFDFKRSYFYDQ